MWFTMLFLEMFYTLFMTIMVSTKKYTTTRYSIKTRPLQVRLFMESTTGIIIIPIIKITTSILMLKPTPRFLDSIYTQTAAIS